MGGEVVASLVAPPTRTGAFRLLGRGLSALLRAPWLVAQLWLARLLRIGGEVAVAFLFLGALGNRLERGDDPLAAVVHSLGDPGLQLPLLGLLLTAWVVGYAVELLVWAGAGRVLASATQRRGRADAGAYGRGVELSFAKVARWALLCLVVYLVFAAVTLPPALAALLLWGRAPREGMGGWAAAAALASSLCILLLGWHLLASTLRLSLVRVVAFGDRALVSLYEGAALLGRRFLTVLALAIAIGFVGWLLSSSIETPAAFLPPTGWGLALRTAFGALSTLALAALSLLHVAALIGLAADDVQGRRASASSSSAASTA